MADRYPLALHHPNEQPAILSDDYEHGVKPPVGYGALPGRARMFPPVTVHDENQEEFYIAKGYIVGPSNKPAFIPRPVAVRREAPKVESVDTSEYPKYVDGPNGPEIAKNAVEEAEIIAKCSGGAGQDGECPGEQPRQPVEEYPGLATGDPVKAQSLRWVLLRQAKELGVAADRTWKIADMESAISEVQREKQTEAAHEEGQSVWPAHA